MPGEVLLLVILVGTAIYMFTQLYFPMIIDHESRLIPKICGKKYQGYAYRILHIGLSNRDYMISKYRFDHFSYVMIFNFFYCVH